MSQLQLDKPAVPTVFDRVAGRYDLMCRLNPGYQGMLSDAARALMPPAPARLLDLCCGTGLSTRALRRAHPQAGIQALDGSAGMLEVAQRKRLGAVRWLRGDAHDPAAAGVEAPLDGLLMAYGLRNLSAPDLCLQNLLRLLRPGGQLALHDYSLAGAGSERLWRLACRTIVRPLCSALSGAPELFDYLEESVLEFDRRDALAARLEANGFRVLRVIPGRGWQRGIVHTFVARRPA